MKQNMKYCTMLAVVAFLAIANPSFSQAAVAPAPAAAVNSWQAPFTQETLSPDDVQSFEARAMEKVKDFYNYLNIISNPQYDIKLRQEAEKQAIDLFSGNDCTVDKKAITKFLDSCRVLKAALSWQVSNVTSKTELVKNGDSYTGMLTGSVTVGTSAGSTKNISIILARKQKQFGGDMEMVWTVSLYNIE
jgi:hypothetical protein